ncbi:MAG: thiamine-phosphate kinase [Desulfuromonadaceae bacterium]|nr:thiamine-phosphate kinase [Desulfuromonas sp.]MDY0184415.1 thiamine-phosphate kinase [Desulfuromonadaceae bacterium]
MDKNTRPEKKEIAAATLAALGEFGLIERIRQRVRANPAVLTGIGDDCSVCTFPPGEVLLTTKDLLLEDIHFRRTWIDMYSLGWKSAAVNLSDIAAMGGTALYVHLGLGIPAETALDDLEAFMHGFLSLCDQENTTLCGGDTCRSVQGLCISVTVQGSIPQAELCQRSGATPGDIIYVSGTLGDSALALLQLLEGEKPEAHIALRHYRPQPRLQLGRALASQRLASAMIDLSDGIFADLGHILERSGCGAELDTRLIPLSASVQQHLHQQPQRRTQVLKGGEDYELLFTAPAEQQQRIAQLSAELNVPLTAVGKILPAQEGLRSIDHCGITHTSMRENKSDASNPGGFNHFRA